MPRSSTIKTNFTGGELSPRLEGRIDLEKYFDSVKSLKNNIVFPHGGATRRGGTRFITCIKNPSKKVILLPFEFSVSQAYILEFGDLYLRFYKNMGQITSGVSNGAFSSVFSPAFVKTGTDLPVEITTPYLENQLSGIKIAQSADQLFIVHPQHEPMVLSRLSDVSWTIENVDFTDGPYLDSNVTTTTLTPSATTGGSVTITASSVVGINNGVGFKTTDIGRLIRIEEAGNFGYAKIIAFNNETSVTASIIDDFVSIVSQTSWRLGAWSDTTGFPSTVTFHEERLWFAGSLNNPQTLWASRTGDFFNFKPGVNDADPLSYTIASNQINTIRWLSSGKALLIGTAGGEFLATGLTIESGMTPSNIRIVRQSTHGSNNLTPVKIANQTIFVQRIGRKVRQLIWNFDQESFIAPDLTLLSEHITESGIIGIAYQQEPDSIVWCVLGNGKLVGLTYELEQGVFAWHQHEFGGKSDTKGTRSIIESVAVIPPSTATPREEVWVVVRRHINDVTQRFIEVLQGGLETTDSQELSFFVDAGLSLNNPIEIINISKTNPVIVTANSHGLSDGNIVQIDNVAGMIQLNKKQFTVTNKTTNTFELLNENGINHSPYINDGEARLSVTTLSGLSHLENETVSILTDGAAHPDRQVINGSVSLQSPSAIVHIGLPYISEIETQRIEAGSQDGTSQGKIKRINTVRYRFNRTLGAKHGFDRNNLTPLKFRSISHNMNEAPPLFTGDFNIEFPMKWDREGRIILQQDQPLPMSILAIMAIMKTND